jgi:hypothetical protein
MTDSKKWLDKTLDKTMDMAKKASEAGVDLVQRSYQRATNQVELGALRRSLDDVHRELGRIAVDRLREAGQLTKEEGAHLLRRVEDLEGQVAAKERLLADLEKDEPRSEPFDEQGTRPGGRRGPDFTSK